MLIFKPVINLISKMVFVVYNYMSLDAKNTGLFFGSSSVLLSELLVYFAHSFSTGVFVFFKFLHYLSM